MFAGLDGKIQWKSFYCGKPSRPLYNHSLHSHIIEYQPKNTELNSKYNYLPFSSDALKSLILYIDLVLNKGHISTIIEGA